MESGAQNQSQIERYGLGWPVETTAATIELACYRLGGTREHDQAWHLKRAIKELWPEPIYMWSYWSDRIVEAWCDNDWLTVWGASSTGKSTTFGLVSLAHWMSAPWCTTMTVCSTTKDALRKRIWCEVLKFYSHVRGAPGRYYPGRTAIIYPQVADPNSLESFDFDENAPEIKESRSGIFGVAVQKGTIQESFSNLIGVHNTYNALLLDEMQSVREAAVEAVSNLQGGKEFKFVGMGNPSSRLDLLGRYSKPKSGKWQDINANMDGWETDRGYCIFLDGRKSPAIVTPGGATKYSFLLKQTDIDTRRKWFGENSFKFWSQTIGFIPPDDAEQTVFTETFIIHNGMDGQADWDYNFELVAGIDWAFTEGGDRCILQPARVGRVNGVHTIEFMETVLISIDVSDDEPTSFITAKKAMRECMRLGIKPEMVGCDTSATQGPQTDILEQVWEFGVLRVGFGGKASDALVKSDEDKPASEVYANRMTELWYQLYNLGRARQVRGVDADLSLELISRRLAVEKQGRTNQLLRLESKQIMKGRTGKSPDIADGAVIAVEVAVQRLGLVVEGLNVTHDGVGDYIGLATEINENDSEAYGTSMEEAYSEG